MAEKPVRTEMKRSSTVLFYAFWILFALTVTGEWNFGPYDPWWTRAAPWIIGIVSIAGAGLTVYLDALDAREARKDTAAKEAEHGVP